MVRAGYRGLGINYIVNLKESPQCSMEENSVVDWLDSEHCYGNRTPTTQSKPQDVYAAKDTKRISFNKYLDHTSNKCIEGESTTTVPSSRSS